MHYIDLHCDTLLETFLQKKDDMATLPGAVDLNRLREARCIAQVFAIFMPGPGSDTYKKFGDQWDDASYIDWCFKVYEKNLAHLSDIDAILSFEDGRPLAGENGNGSIEKLEEYHRRGIRLVTITWNGENCLGYPNSKDAAVMEKGLKPFGKEAVRRMLEIGVIPDVSHLSDGGFADAAAISREAKKPFVASHSNCRALSPHTRNLTDEQIKTLAECGGVAGLNFCPWFLNKDTENSKESRIETMIAHLRHLIKFGGIEVAAIGTDFDGISGSLEIGGAEKMPLLFDALSAAGFSENEIEKIAFRNAQRVIDSIAN
jgi:membrane dipeptidase